MHTDAINTSKRLFIDLYLCDACEKCEVDCSYFYKPHPGSHGLFSLRELATFLLVCRRCQNPCCVAACAFEALERQDDGTLKRYTMRCVSCKSCAHACPFGTIYPDLVPYYASRCNLCETAQEGTIPPCVSKCAKKAISYKEIEPNENEGIFLINPGLAVRAPRWQKEEG
ncbi:4Fe-4S binding protein [candidate division FCPU426 bacterium]|nr:4Fe-4S binding protein [candidate division FCPU426 bacterium]